MIAVLLVLQLPQWAEVLRVLTDPAYTPARPYHWDLYERTGAVFAHGSFWDVIEINSWTGQAAKWGWVIETYRYPQMPDLFVCGLLPGSASDLDCYAQPVYPRRPHSQCRFWLSDHDMFLGRIFGQHADDGIFRQHRLANGSAIEFHQYSRTALGGHRDSEPSGVGFRNELLRAGSLVNASAAA